MTATIETLTEVLREVILRQPACGPEEWAHRKRLLGMLESQPPAPETREGEKAAWISGTDSGFKCGAGVERNRILALLDSPEVRLSVLKALDEFTQPGIERTLGALATAVLQAIKQRIGEG